MIAPGDDASCGLDNQRNEDLVPFAIEPSDRGAKLHRRWRVRIADFGRSRLLAWWPEGSGRPRSELGEHRTAIRNGDLRAGRAQSHAHFPITGIAARTVMEKAGAAQDVATAGSKADRARRTPVLTRGLAELKALFLRIPRPQF